MLLNNGYTETVEREKKIMLGSYKNKSFFLHN